MALSKSQNCHAFHRDPVMPAQAGIHIAGLDPRFRGGRLRSPVERGETALSGVTALPPAQRGATRLGAVV